MRKKIFGNHIVPSCSYCLHSKNQGRSQYCGVSRVLKNGKCRKFTYNPIMRRPYGMAQLEKFTKEDFKTE